jgi:hypothetical protein
MKNVFISSARIDEDYCQALIRKLQGAGFIVSHSPKNPHDGDDPRWGDWYSTGLNDELNRAQIFIIAITPGWDCSTWMASEAHSAKELYGEQKIERYFHWNPCGVKADAAGMQPFLINELPEDLDKLITKLM